MLTIALIATATAFALFIAPAVCLQLFVSRCWGVSAVTEGAASVSGATSPAQPWAAVVGPEVKPVSR